MNICNICWKENKTENEYCTLMCKNKYIQQKKEKKRIEELTFFFSLSFYEQNGWIIDKVWKVTTRSLNSFFKIFPEIKIFLFKNENYNIDYYSQFFYNYCYPEKIGICKECWKSTEFQGFKYWYREFCSRDCQKKNSNIKEKIQKTKKEKYWENYEKIWEKQENTLVEKYWQDYWQKIQKIRETKLLEKHGVKNVMLLESTKDTIDNTKKKYYQDFLNTNEQYKVEKYSNWTIFLYHTKCGNISEYDQLNLKYRKIRWIELCQHCNPFRELPSSSYIELDLCSKIKWFYNWEVINNYKFYKSEIDKRLFYEIDIYLPSLWIWIEFNWIHRHTYKRKDYHKEKYLFFKEKWINLIQIWEDTYILKQDIILSHIKSKTVWTKNIVYWRNCTTREITSIEKNKFLNNTHIMWEDKSKYNIWLYYEETLIWVMTVKKQTLDRKHNNQNILELSRLSFHSDYRVIWWASKMLQYFIKNYRELYKGYKLITYHDLDLWNSFVYDRIWFTFMWLSEPWYFYIKENGNTREHRFKYRKQELIKQYPEYRNLSEQDIMLQLWYLILYNSGNKRYEYKL